MSSDFGIWIGKSKDNLKWAEDNLKIGNYPLVCYLAQQSTELLLKGCLYFKNQVPPKTHNLLFLSKKCEELGFDLKEVEVKLATLTEYYAESRYPDTLNTELDSLKIAGEALDVAKEIQELVVPQLK